MAACCSAIIALTKAPKPFCGLVCRALLDCEAVALLLALLMDSEDHCRAAAKALGAMATASEAVQVFLFLNFPSLYSAVVSTFFGGVGGSPWDYPKQC